jgi:hypothetical protein
MGGLGDDTIFGLSGNFFIDGDLAAIIATIKLMLKENMSVT